MQSSLRTPLLELKRRAPARCTPRPPPATGLSHLATLRAVFSWAPGPALSPMLAVRGTPGPSEDGWAVEPKWDGWRVLVYVAGDVRVLTRNGRDITAAVPELRPLGETVPTGTVLDGELIVRQGRAIDFYALGPRLWSKRSDRPAVTFVAFDLLAALDTIVIDQPYTARRALLETLDLDGCAAITPSFTGPADIVLDGCERLGLEGVVLKQPQSPYLPGRRSRFWRKVKTAEWREVHAPARFDH